MIQEMICKQCGKAYIGDHRSHYCDECKANGVAKVKIAVGSVKECENCGAAFVLKSPAQKYCEKCRVEVAKKNHVNSNRRYIYKTYGRINVQCAKDKKAEIENHASKMGESVNGFILRAIDAQIQLDNSKE